MATQHDPSVEDLRRESERSRAALASTVVELREKISDTASELKTRISPEHLKEEVKGYVREGSDQFLQSIERKARENPLPALAIGAGLAYPLWSLVRAMPAPVMLIGAGLWLAKKSGSDGKTNADHLQTKAADLAANLASHLGATDLASRMATPGSDLASSVSGIASAAKDGLDRGTGAIADASSRAGAALSTSATSATEMLRTAGLNARTSITEAGEKLIGTASSAASDVGTKASTVLASARERTAQAGEKSVNGLVEIVERNPLLVAGIGLAIGAFIAASLPTSNVENRAFGKPSDDLKEKAREAAAQGVERAKGAAADLVGDVASAAAREGLSVDGLHKAAEGLTESVKSVVNRGVKTALGEAPSLQPATEPFKS